MKIGILQTGIAADGLKEKHGDYPDMFAAMLQGRGFTFEYFQVVNGQFPSGADSCEGWLITGSKHGAYEDHEWIAPLEDLIREIYAQDRPMIGVCFGHQIIAQALGGHVEKFKGGWIVGRQTYQDKDGNELVLNAYHQDQVITPPDSVTKIQGNPYCENAVLTYGTKAYTMQPHPEFSSDYVAELIDVRGVGVIDDDLLATARAGLQPNIDAQKVADQFEAFFKRQ